ncbi:small ribosomal subunit biogenesis GTPase RsgA [Leptolyngbya sp. FACHB-321]|uniref:small ribosomal subunit biogenesis GTPase RsgA n=1 Tax=Leptolyngbya sp. FACHB-321 TaxID=2692807 RepID=UPI001685DDBD|nr:small ribosomal subunit biogenesis GTPase RsgA [Leptolyngbya sp. FACHB-321]MBD2035144.1 small ribosomal subunit biogenesis GTPase RsgA [Leptolyngbya sp. FACHB-321]
MSSHVNDHLNIYSKAEPENPTARLWGIVLAVQANYYHVQLDAVQRSADSNDNALSTMACKLPVPQMLLCTRRSRLKKIGQRVMVGDRVEVVEPDWDGGRGAIAQVLPRQSELDRPPVANADQLLLVFAMVEPTLDPHQLSHFLVKAETTQLQVCLCLNKSDLASADEREHWQKRLQQWGYTPFLISVHQTWGLIDLEAQLGDRITIVSGPSGVGKSSLINRLVPSSDLRVASVSGKLGRGRHTTRHVELFELPAGGLLADTPGFNQPDLDCAPEDLANYFPEARARLAMASCQFSNCLHKDEPNCAVRGDWERYEHYLHFLEESIVRQEALNKLSNSESTLKRKSDRAGEQYEPKLETKKYRRPSRRVQQQTLQGMRYDLKDASLDGD